MDRVLNFDLFVNKFLRVSTKVILKGPLKIENFLDKEPGHAKLKDWLKWWVLRKEHIFRALKNTLSPHSNLVEVIHSSWV